MPPRQVTSLIQRVGRAGHSLARVSKGVTVTVSSDDTLESLAAAEAARERELEPLTVHRHARDVLAHQIVGCVLDAGGRGPDQTIARVIPPADPHPGLPADAFHPRVDFLPDLRRLRREGTDLLPTAPPRRDLF